MLVFKTFATFPRMSSRLVRALRELGEALQALDDWEVVSGANSPAAGASDHPAPSEPVVQESGSDCSARAVYGSYHF